MLFWGFYGYLLVVVDYGVCLDFGCLGVCGFGVFFRAMFYLSAWGMCLKGVTLFGFGSVFCLLGVWDLRMGLI